MVRKLCLVGVLALITLFCAAVFGKKAQAQSGKKLSGVTAIAMENRSLEH